MMGLSKSRRGRGGREPGAQENGGWKDYVQEWKERSLQVGQTKSGRDEER